MLVPYVHRIDPIVGETGSLYLRWYGLSFTFGFSGIHLWLRRVHRRLGLSMREVYGISLSVTIAGLLGGRLIEIFSTKRIAGAAPRCLAQVGKTNRILTVGVMAVTSRGCRRPGGLPREIRAL